MVPIYRRGAQGPEVARLQARLAELGHYRGPVDMDFGSGTESAVRSWQKQHSLAASGIVDAAAWGLFFPGQSIPPPSLWSEPLWKQCLALTARMETNQPLPECFTSLAGDFDGQGISFGALQWNLGQQTLQPLVQKMDRNHSTVLTRIFGANAAALRAVLRDSQAGQMAWARSIQDAARRLHEPWRGQLKTLGRCAEYQEIQMLAAQEIFRRAEDQCAAYGVRSARARAVLFDIQVQNGGISRATRAAIRSVIGLLPHNADSRAAELARLRIIANRCADAASRRWREDVRARKRMIAEGDGAVHGTPFHLEEQYGIRMQGPGMWGRSCITNRTAASSSATRG